MVSPTFWHTPHSSLWHRQHTQLGDLGTGQADHWHPPDDIKENICVVNLAIHTVIVQRNDVIQLGDRDVHICMVTGVQ